MKRWMGKTLLVWRKLHTPYSENPGSGEYPMRGVNYALASFSVVSVLFAVFGALLKINLGILVGIGIAIWYLLWLFLLHIWPRVTSYIEEAKEEAKAPPRKRKQKRNIEHLLDEADEDAPYYEDLDDDQDTEKH